MICPFFMQDTFYLINNRSDDLEVRDLIRELIDDPDFRELEDDEEYEIPEEIHYRRLISLLALGNLQRGAALVIASAIIGACDQNFTPSLRAVLESCGFNFETCTLDEFLAVMKIQTDRHRRMAGLERLNVAHYVLVART